MAARAEKRLHEAEDWLEGGPTGLSKTELAALTGLSPKKIDALVRAGMPRTPGATRRAGDQFFVPEIFSWLLNDHAEDPMALARRRKVEAEAARLETANRKITGELIPVAEVRREIAEGMTALRSALLAIPARLVDQPDEVKRQVRAEITESINSLAFTYGDEDATAA